MLFRSAQDGLGYARDVAFGTDGNLYVTSGNSHEVLRYDGVTGALIDAFVSAGSGGLETPRSLVFDADDNLYVAGSGMDTILHYGRTPAPVHPGTRPEGSREILFTLKKGLNNERRSDPIKSKERMERSLQVADSK